MNEHTVQRFDNDLDKLRSRLIKMGTLVQQQMSFTLQALANSDNALAELIIANDDKIDKVDIKIDKQCMQIFAIHQPLASDLRMVVTALSINDLIELIGDTLVDIAKSIGAMQDNPFLIRKTRLIHMGEIVEKMINKIVDAYIYTNWDLSKDNFELIKDVRSLRQQNFEILSQLVKENVDSAVTCLTLQDINRNLKQVADLALNIAQEIVFLAEAKIVKHIRPNIQLVNEIDTDTDSED